MNKRIVPKLPLVFNNKLDFNKLVDFKIKEDNHISFRRIEDLQIDNAKQVQLLMTLVSAMANTVGGKVFYGVECQRNKAVNIKSGFITNSTIEQLEYLLKTEIKPCIENLKIETISCSNGGSLLIIDVPNSEHAPHMANDGYYYKRQDTKNVRLQEFEIRELYQRSKKTDLDIFAILNTNGIPTLESGKYQKVNFYPRFLVKNISSVIEHHFKTELYIPSGIYNPNFSVLQQHFSRLEEQYSVFSVSNNSPLFQHELATVMEANLIVDADNYEIFANNDIIVKLYYSNGIKTKFYTLVDTFLYQNKPLSADDFTDQFRLLS